MSTQSQNHKTVPSPQVFTVFFILVISSLYLVIPSKASSVQFQPMPKMSSPNVYVFPTQLSTSSKNANHLIAPRQLLDPRTTCLQPRSPLALPSCYSRSSNERPKTVHVQGPQSTTTIRLAWAQSPSTTSTGSFARPTAIRKATVLSKSDVRVCPSSVFA